MIPSAESPAEADRYCLYINYTCPWAHRANCLYELKRLNGVIQRSILDSTLGEEGWFWSGVEGTDPHDPVNGFKKLKEVYLFAHPGYDKRFTVPVLFDKKQKQNSQQRVC